VRIWVVEVANKQIDRVEAIVLSRTARVWVKYATPSMPILTAAKTATERPMKTFQRIAYHLTRIVRILAFEGEHFFALKPQTTNSPAERYRANRR
jgi:hypothetical protein